LDALSVDSKPRCPVFSCLGRHQGPSYNYEAANSVILSFMNEDTLESLERVECPSCGKPFTLRRMNVCSIARQTCPNCEASILIEGDKVTAET